MTGTLAVQIARLPLPAGYTTQIDLPICEGFDAAALDAIDPSEVAALVTHSMVGMPAPLWERFPKLRAIANFGVGIDRIDLDEARRRGVAVTYTPDHLTADVADLALAFTLALLRRVPAADAFVRHGGWAGGPFPLGTSASGCKVGILGLGRIGKAIATRAKAFGMEVAYWSRTAQRGTPYRFHTEPGSLAEWSDVLIAALPGGAETDRIISADTLRRLGSDGILVNIARASVVDEAALIGALTSKEIAGAGLELFSPDSSLPAALAGVENVLMTPHIGSATRQTRTAMADSVFANVRAALVGGMLTDRAA